jgi:hypothetical protein
MEDSDREKNSSNASEDMTLTGGKHDAGEQSSKAQRSPRKSDKKSQNTKPKSLGRSWRAASPLTLVGLVIAGIGALAAVAYVGVTVWQVVVSRWAVQVQHAPLIINIRPPELLQPFICDPVKGFHTGNMQTTIRNIGTASAFHVMPFWNVTKIIPEKKTNNNFYDALPEANCRLHPKTNESDSPLAPGREMSPQIRQMAGTIPPIGKNDPAQLYWVSCVYYSDEYGGSHGTCDRYRLMFPNSNNPLDVLSGSPTFFCDATPKIGKFADTIGGHCQE